MRTACWHLLWTGVISMAWPPKWQELVSRQPHSLMQKAEASVWSVHTAAPSAPSKVYICMGVVLTASSCGVSVACVIIRPIVGWPGVD